MRLTFVLDSPTCGGAERYLCHLVERVDAEVTVIATDPVCRDLARAAREAGELVLLGSLAPEDGGRPLLAAALRRARADVVHVNCIDPTSNRLLHDVAQAARIPTVATVHLAGVLPGGREDLRDLHSTFDGVDVIAVSEEIRHLLEVGVGVAPSSVAMIRNGVPPLPLVRRPPSDHVVLGGLGRLTPQKGFDLLIDAVARLRGAGRPVTARIAGDGRDRSQLLERARGLPVELVGHVDDVAGFLATVDVLCLPSRAEGLPLALLEAMSAGLPCVATAVGEIPAAVGDAAVIVPPEDLETLVGELDALVGDPIRRASLGDRAADVARRDFHVDRMVEETRSVYERARRRARHGLGSAIRG